jgi:uncharacterized DUF497 family protein
MIPGSIRSPGVAYPGGVMDAAGFEWDDEKAESNYRKHGVTFAEAATVFDDPLAATTADLGHSDGEDRFLTVGMSVQNRILVVIHTYRGGRTRIISAREATRREQIGIRRWNLPVNRKTPTTCGRSTTSAT